MADPRETHPYLRTTCYGVPVQIEGETPDGNTVYFRFRYGTATVQITGETTWTWTEKVSDDLDGSMDETEALRLVAALVDLHAALQAVRASRAPIDPEVVRAEMERFFNLSSPGQD
ncbi:hypothetical protein [Streptomyces sp. NPDC059278]|uniref:hypothetical protein n=1 Tax=Streptomyces sp. NPDC059278 TaxID=3346801 RepID=UPI0036742EF5